MHAGGLGRTAGTRHARDQCLITRIRETRNGESVRGAAYLRVTMGRAVGGAAEKVRTLAAAQGVDDVDGHALAGFIEAEGSFSISVNNGGRSWLCGMSLNQRADDADLLCDIVLVTGLGRLYAVPARRTSRPQVVWSIASKVECRELARLLRAARRR